jgi:hypothetical protein
LERAAAFKALWSFIAIAIVDRLDELDCRQRLRVSWQADTRQPAAAKAGQWAFQDRIKIILSIIELESI